MSSKFEQWKGLVNDIVFVSIGYRLDDLPDEDYRVNYDNGLHFCDMAKKVIDDFELETFFV